MPDLQPFYAFVLVTPLKTLHVLQTVGDLCRAPIGVGPKSLPISRFEREIPHAGAGSINQPFTNGPKLWGAESRASREHATIGDESNRSHCAAEHRPGMPLQRANFAPPSNVPQPDRVV